MDALTVGLGLGVACAAGELIVIGEQNLVRETFPTDRLHRYKALYDAYDGDGVLGGNDAFLENYRRIVNHVGRSFPNTGIEILLHNLVNPSRSLVAIENSAVTGRSIGGGAIHLVLDLKTRRQRGEDKINYEPNIGSRRFKCTTIPIFRPDYGLVGAICINVDIRFMREYVMSSEERLLAFFDNLLRTDFKLGENILSRDEYVSAQSGKRHFLDDAIRAAAPGEGERKLAAILFSDIVGYTALMGGRRGGGPAHRRGRRADPPGGVRGAPRPPPEAPGRRPARQLRLRVGRGRRGAGGPRKGFA